MAQLDVVVVESGIQQTSTKLDKLTESGKKAESASKNLAGQTSKTGYVVGQFGYQIQDAITQLEMGTDYFRVIGQQAPQALGALGGAAGAAGAVVSILAVAAGVLSNELGVAEVSSSELAETQKNLKLTIDETQDGTVVLTKRIAELADRSRDLAEIEIAKSIKDANLQIKAANESVKDASSTFESWFSSLRGGSIADAADELKILSNSGMSLSDAMVAAATGSSSLTPSVENLSIVAAKVSGEFNISTEESLKFIAALGRVEESKSPESIKNLAVVLNDLRKNNKDASDELVDYADVVTKASESSLNAADTIKKLKEFAADLVPALNDAKSAASGTADEISKMAQAADEAVFALGKTRGEIAAHQAALKGADIVEQEYIKTQYDKVDAYNKQQEAQKKAASDAKSAAQEAERAAKQEQQRYSANEAKIADAILKTQQLTQERENLTNGTDRIVAGTSRYSQKTAELAAQQQLGATATGEQVKRLADQLLAQDKVTESIEKAKKAEEDKKKLSDFTSGFQKDAYDASDKTDLERQKKYHEDRLKQIEDNNNTEFAKSVEGRKMITDAKLAEDQRYNDMKSQIEQQAMLNTAASISSSLSYMTNAMSSAGKETTAMYRVIFAAQKAAAIPSMIISTQKAYLDTINNSGLGVWAIPLAETVRAAGYASIGVVAAQAIAGRAQGGQVIAGQTYNVGERGMETFTPSQNGWITPNGGNTNNISATNNVYNYAGVNVKTTPNESGGTDTYITRDEFADLMAVHGADPNSKFNRSRGAVYRQQRA